LHIRVLQMEQEKRQTLASLPSLPEPPPQPRGQVVPVRLLAFIENAKSLELDPSFDEMRNDQLDKLADLIQQRNAFGMQKYGQPLYSQDGRNGLEDARQELDDLLQYVCKVQMSPAGQHTEEEKQDFLNLFNTAAVLVRVILQNAQNANAFCAFK